MHVIDTGLEIWCSREDDGMEEGTTEPVTCCRVKHLPAQLRGRYLDIWSHATIASQKILRSVIELWCQHDQHFHRQ